MARILYLDHTASVSGAEISLLDCLSKLDRLRFHPLLVCPPDGPLADKARSMGIDVRTIKLPYLSFSDSYLKCLFSPLAILCASYRLRSIIKGNNIELVHANSVRAGIIGTAAVALTGIPVVWHVRDFLPNNLRSKIIRWISGTGANKIIAISQAVEDNFSPSQKQKEKTSVIYDGVNLNKYNPSLIDVDQSRSRLNFSDAFPIIAIFGQIIDWKGQREFIKAASQIVAAFPNARFLVVGEALFRTDRTIAYKRELLDLAEKLRISKKVVFTGFREDIPELMTASDILVLASWKEPLGMVQLEAMALEKPVIATNAGGTKEVVKDGTTGILVPPKDPDAIARSVSYLAKDPHKLSDMGKAGRKRIEQCFNLDSHVQKVEHLYEELLHAESDHSSLDPLER